MSNIKGVDPLSIPSTSKKRSAHDDLKVSAKKTNLQNRYNIPVNNPYDSLSDEEDANEDEAYYNNQSQPTPQSYNIPPIVVYSYFKEHVKAVKELQKNLNEDVDLKYKGKKIIILTKTVADHTYVRKELEEADLPFTTRTPLTERELKLVIRNLPPNITADEVKNDLIEKRLPVINVSQITKKENNTVVHAYPLFLVTFKQGTDYRTIFQHKKICYCLIHWEKIKKNRVTQCFRCQSFGHIAQNCTKVPRCVICGEQHPTRSCINKSKPPKCANCTGDHAASYRQCPKRPQMTNNDRAHRKPIQKVPNNRDFPTPSFSTPTPPTPGWPRQKQASPNNTATDFKDIINICKNFLQNFNLSTIIRKIQTLVSRLNAAPDGASKLMIVIDFAMALLD